MSLCACDACVCVAASHSSVVRRTNCVLACWKVVLLLKFAGRRWYCIGALVVLPAAIFVVIEITRKGIGGTQSDGSTYACEYDSYQGSYASFDFGCLNTAFSADGPGQYFSCNAQMNLTTLNITSVVNCDVVHQLLVEGGSSAMSAPDGICRESVTVRTGSCKGTFSIELWYGLPNMESIENVSCSPLKYWLCNGAFVQSF